MLILTTFEGGLWCSNLEIPAYIVGLKRITRESGTKHTISSFFKWAGDVNGNARPLCFISKTGSDSVSEFGSNLMASKNFCRENHESGMNKKYIKEKGQNCWLRKITLWDWTKTKTYLQKSSLTTADIYFCTTLLGRVWKLK